MSSYQAKYVPLWFADTSQQLVSFTLCPSNDVVIVTFSILFLLIFVFPKYPDVEDVSVLQATKVVGSTSSCISSSPKNTIVLFPIVTLPVSSIVVLSSDVISFCFSRSFNNSSNVCAVAFSP